MNYKEFLNCVLLLVRIRELETGLPLGNSLGEGIYTVTVDVFGRNITATQNSKSFGRYNWEIKSDKWAVAFHYNAWDSDNIQLVKVSNEDLIKSDFISLKLLVDKQAANLEELQEKRQDMIF